ncbi:Protein EPIDERMAL PATTERNING FACTOR 1 [Ranunculus cassubicifolius]
MKISHSIAMDFMVILLILTVVSARHVHQPHSRHNHQQHHISSVKPEFYGKGKAIKSIKHVRPDTVQLAGSRLPDCSHACGSCRRCRLVMVSYVCSSLEEAETCPMAYKCMCNRKSYPVP